MSEIRVKTANPDTITSIPEVLGNIKVKDPNGDLRDVKKMYAKTGAGDPVLVWDTNVVDPPTTDISTQSTPEPPFCFECLPNSEVYYPVITKQGKRWDFCEWQKSNGSIEASFQNSVNTNTELYYIFDYQFDQPNFNPPPPNYIIFNYKANKPGVRFQLFVARESINVDNILFYKPRSTQSVSEICFAGCFPEDVNTGGVTIDPCIQTIPIDDNPFHKLYDSETCECIQSSRPNFFDNSPNAPECRRECESYCYGVGTTGYLFQLTSSYYGFTDTLYSNLSCSIAAPLRPVYAANYNNSNTTDYLCENYSFDPDNIDSTRFPLFAKTTNYAQTIPNPKFEYDSDNTDIKTYLTLNDVRLTIDYCDNPSSIPPSSRDAANPQIRLILPIYVNIPEYADKAIIFNQNTNIPIFYGEGGLLTNTPSSQNLTRINPLNSNYNKIIHEAYRIAKGEIKMSSLVLAKEDNKKYWGAIGYSKYSDANNSATHTHFLVINWAKCDGTNPGVCGPMDDEQYNTCFTGNRSFSVETFSFLPLKNKYTNDISEPYKSYMNGQVITAPTTYKGIQSIKQINEELSFCTDEDADIFGPPTFKVGKYYVDTGTTQTTEPNGITFKKLYDAYYQPYITTTETINCNTTCI
jgi:hypothetical protein